jgi:RNA polymerase sigma-70 factor (ECF subfamily)
MTGRDPIPVTDSPGLEIASRPDRSPAPRSRDDSGLAVQVQGLVASGNLPAARERFADIVRKHQRRASQIAFHYLRDAADADEATQDAFVKAFLHIESFRPQHSFEVWFTRILVNSCLDRKRARQRRERWLLPALDHRQGELNVLEGVASRAANPEQRLLAREQRAQIAGAVRRLPPQQRTVFLLCAYGGHSTREAAEVTDLSESTVRVHLFRAVRKLRVALKAGHHVDRQTR